MAHYDVLVIGGGTAGIMVAAQLKKADQNISIGILDPSEKHYYQPAWTLVGANTYDFDKTVRDQKDFIPKGVDWIKEAATAIDPDAKQVTSSSGKTFDYKILAVCPGLVMRPDMVGGLEESLDKGVVCSNYTNPRNTWRVLDGFKGGTALFTQPTTPIKCGGAPQKIMYLADDLFRKRGIRNNTKIVFATPGTVIFGVPEIKKTLMEVIDRKDIHVLFGHNLVEVDAANGIAWYELADHAAEYNSKDIEILKEGSRVGIKFDMMHLAPPQQAPDFIRTSTLADAAGWLDVDKHTLQHTRYSNIFGIGDVTNLPTAKTGAAVRKQVPVAVANIREMLAREAIISSGYNGYSSCPLVTGYGKMVLAEFDYDNNFMPDPKLKRMFISDSSKEHWRLWILKKYLLPYLYWNKMMKGEQV